MTIPRKFTWNFQSQTLEPELYNLELNLPKSKNLPILVWTSKHAQDKKCSQKGLVKKILLSLIG
jgi:hypothetical protein